MSSSLCPPVAPVKLNTATIICVQIAVPAVHLRAPPPSELPPPDPLSLAVGLYWPRDSPAHPGPCRPAILAQVACSLSLSSDLAIMLRRCSPHGGSPQHGRGLVRKYAKEDPRSLIPPSLVSSLPHSPTLFPCNPTSSHSHRVIRNVGRTLRAL